MELGPNLDSVRSLYLHSDEPLDDGLLNMLVKKQQGWRATRTGVKPVLQPLVTPTAKLIIKPPLWTRLSDSKAGTNMWNGSLSNEKATGCFAKPATPKLRRRNVS